MEVQDKIIKFYLNLRAEEDHDRFFFLDIHAKVLGDIMFVIPQLLSIRHKTEAGWPIYVIKNVYNQMLERQLSHIEVKTTTHGYEYGFLFGETFLGKVNFTEEDLKFRDLLVNAIVQFVKTR